MLRRLKVVNFAVVESIDLELQSGFTAFTGETGAGKSILVEALGFLLGARGSSSWLRAGAERLIVEGTFDSSSASADFKRRWAIAASGIIELKRELDASGKTRAFIGGRPVPVAALAEFGATVADFSAQNESQTLLRPQAQLDLLDSFAELEKDRLELGKAHEAWKELKARVDSAAMSEEERRRRIELLEFQISEIDAASLVPGEDEAIEQSLPRLKNAERLRALADQAYELLYAGEEASLPRQQIVARLLGDLAKIDPGAETMRAELDAALAQAGGVERELASYRERVESDPAALDNALSRQETLSRLKKRHGETIADVLDARGRMANELENLSNADERRESAQKELAAAENRLERLCERLHDLRLKAAKRLDAAVLKELKVLGLPHARFTCSVEMEEGNWSATGADVVEFLLAANPGQSPRPIKSTASGGELSRVMLALKTTFAKGDRTSLLVFDEVDSGIGGEVARIVGERLAALSAQRQVLCVTHLPHVACFARAHFHVVKDVAGGRTRVRVERLDGQKRLDAVAVMLGGRGATAASRKHAQELMESVSL